MTFRVVISPRARQDLEVIHNWIAGPQHAPDNAALWLNAILESIHSLSKHPRRFAKAPEGNTLGFEIRQLVFRSYRVLFTISHDSVEILHIRHAARLPWHFAED